MIVETVTVGLLGLLGYMIKENTRAMKDISKAISYCPTNQKNKKNIKH